MSSEFSTLLAELKEQVLYMQELGVSDFGIQLPEIDARFQNSNSLPIQNPKSEIQNRLERFVPESLPIAPAAKPEIKPNSTENSSRQSLLEKTRLSRLPSLANRNISSKSFQSNQNPEQAERIVMPTKKQETPAEETSESLFGDISRKLPESNETLEEIRADIGNCTRCPLHEGRTKIVHSTGNLQAELMFVGEAPGADEDAKGEPFVGRAGQLLNKIIEAIGMKREDVFIGNINRCRPPGNRTPTLPEAHTCRPFLLREIAVVRPKIIVVMGNTACQNLLDTKVGISKIRGNFQDYFGVKVMPTFHPAYLLRDPSKKRETWEDMKKVRDELNKLKG